MRVHVSNYNPDMASVLTINEKTDEMRERNGKYVNIEDMLTQTRHWPIALVSYTLNFVPPPPSERHAQFFQA